MAKGGAGGGQREGSALKTAVVVTGGLVLAWITVEAAFKPFLDRLRAAVTRSTEPARDPDEEPARTAAEPSALPLPTEEEEEGEKKKGEDKEGEKKKGEDKEVELEEKGEGAVSAKAE